MSGPAQKCGLRNEPLRRWTKFATRRSSTRLLRAPTLTLTLSRQCRMSGQETRMPAAAHNRHNRRWVTAALIGLTVPLLTFSTATHAAFADTDDQKLSQLQQSAASAASDIGVRDASAEKAAEALAKIRTQVATANGALASANKVLSSAQKVLIGKRNA